MKIVCWLLLSLCTIQVLNAQTTLSNFNALFESSPLSAKNRAIITDSLKEHPLVKKGLPVQVEEHLGVPTFLFASDNVEKQRMRSTSKKQQLEPAARAYLAQFASLYRMNSNTLAEAELKNIHDTGRGGIIVQFEQRIDDVEVFLSSMKVMMKQDLDLVALSGYFSPHKTSKKQKKEAPITAQKAIVHAFQDMGGTVSSTDLTLSHSKLPYRYFESKDFGSDYILREPARVKEVWFTLQDRLVYGYYIELVAGYFDVKQTETFSYVISAENGEVLFRNNLSAHADFTYDVYADSDGKHMPFDGPRGPTVTPFPISEVPEADDYSELPEAHFISFLPDQVSLNTISLSHASISTGDPWLADNATQTVGNNVDAYVDISGNNGLDSNDFRATTTAFRTFSYPHSLALEPGASSKQRNAAIVNLFYVNNFLHDWFYDSGFDESSGNAQANNYGRGGVGGDRLLAEAQDHSDTNNATMTTLADGNSPRMQMHLFDGNDNIDFTVLTPPKIAGEMIAGAAQFGPQSFDLTGNLVRYVDDNASGNEGTIYDGCEMATNANVLNGNIALIDRGECLFVLKVSNAQAAGASGVVVVNNRDGNVIVSTMSGTDTSISIPSMFVSQNNGAHIKEQLAQNKTVQVQLGRGPGDILQKDGTFDNSIIAHEWGHYISNRLIGNANGLNNNQGGSLGEGWGDFHSLLMAVREEDRTLEGNEQFQGIYSASGHAAPTFYFGVRRAPYSTDFQWNALTFKHIENDVALNVSHPLRFGQDGTNNAQVHASGSIWANILWEVYAAILNHPDRSFDQAQQQMVDYLVASYKMTPFSPTFTEARDAMLSAISSNSATDYQLALSAFAKRGMGPNAISPSRSSSNHSGVVEDIVASGHLAFGQAVLDKDWKYCDRDGIWDSGETSLLEITLINDGSISLQDTTATVVAPSGKVIFSNDGKLNFPQSSAGQSVSASIEMTLSDDFSYERSETIVLNVTYADSAANITPLVETIVVNTNFSLIPSSTSKDTVSSDYSDWAFSSSTSDTWRTADSKDLNIANIDTSKGYGYFVSNPTRQSDITLTSPLFTVGNSSGLLLTFEHVHNFEEGKYDGGVVEMKVICCDPEQGTWHDINYWSSSSAPIMTPGYNQQSLYAAGSNPLAGREAFVESSVAYPAFITETIDLRNRLDLDDQFQIRFRMGSDSLAGGVGWLIDDIEVQGLASVPFQTAVNDTGCGTTNHIIEAGWHLLNPGEVGALDTLLQEQDEISSIWGWTGTEWQVKFRNNPAVNPFSELSQLNKSNGYWFRSEGSATITGAGGTQNHFSGFNLSNANGWHLLGTTQVIDVVPFFANTLPDNATVWVWKQSQWEVYTKGDTGTVSQFNTTYGTQFSPLRQIEPSTGFWVNLTTSNSGQ